MTVLRIIFLLYIVIESIVIESMWVTRGSRPRSSRSL
jgi:hypothetical protein